MLNAYNVISRDDHKVDLSVIVVNYNTRHLLAEMMVALENAATGIALQVILVDNASRDGSVDYIRSTWPALELIANSVNVGFGRANNQALPLLRGRNVLLLNTDAFMSPDSLRVALDCLGTDSRIGIVGARLTSRGGSVQPSCRYFPTPWNTFLNVTGLFRLFPGTRLVDDIDWDDRKSAECDWVPGAFFLMRKTVIDQIGLFDPRYFLYCEEVDLCRTAKDAGWKVYYCADTNVVHIGGESAKSDGPLSAGRQLSALQVESELLYYRKYSGIPGVIGAFTLGLMADVILVLKKLLKGRRAESSYFQRTALVLRSMSQTGLGKSPTR